MQTLESDAVKMTTSKISPILLRKVSTCGRLLTYTWCVCPSISIGTMKSASGTGCVGHEIDHEIDKTSTMHVNRLNSHSLGAQTRNDEWTRVSSRSRTRQILPLSRGSGGGSRPPSFPYRNVSEHDTEFILRALVYGLPR